MFRELPTASSLRCCKGLSMGDIRGFHIHNNQEYQVCIYLYSTSDSYTALLCRAKALGFEMC